MLRNTIIDSHFNYVLLIWMFFRKRDCIFGLYHKTLKVIYQPNKTYKALLELREAVSSN